MCLIFMLCSVNFHKMWLRILKLMKYINIESYAVFRVHANWLQYDDQSYLLFHDKKEWKIAVYLKLKLYIENMNSYENWKARYQCYFLLINESCLFTCIKSILIFSFILIIFYSRIYFILIFVFFDVKSFDFYL
jgi:hypothetical protein